jgi:hypothetical protein
MDKKKRSNGGSFGPAKSTDYHNIDDGPWANAIQEATAYAFTAKDEEHDRRRPECSDRRDDVLMDIGPTTQEARSAVEEGIRRVDRSLVYLEELHRLLEQQECREWVPYPCHPPTFCRKNNEVDRNLEVPSSTEKRKTKSRQNAASRSTKSNPDSKSSSTKKKKKETPNIRRSKSGMHWSISENRFAMIAFDSEDDSDDDSSDSDSDSYSDIDNHNDPEEGNSRYAHANLNIEKSLSAEAIPYVPSLSFGEDGGHPQQHGSECMDSMRLLIRLHASQSDLHAKKARLLAAQRRWLPGAGALQSSIIALSHGLELADEAISKIVVAVDIANYNIDFVSQHDENDVTSIGTDALTDHRRAQLERDAEISSVSTKYLVLEKYRYLKAAHRQVTRLERILEPMWKARDAVKKRIGADKWKNNKNRNESFANARLQHERELWSLEEALQQLENSQADAYSLVDEASRLREKLREIRYMKNRYNGRRPILLPRTVHPTHGHETASFAPCPYPSAEEYGWTFTGTIGREDCVHFFEKWVGVGSQHQPQITGLPNSTSSWNESDPNRSINSNNTDNNNYGKVGTFVMVKLDFHFVTGAVRTVVEYPALFDGEGNVVHHAWHSTLDFNNNNNNKNNNNNNNNDDDDAKRVDPALYRQILMDPLSFYRLYGSINVAILHS